MKEDTGCPQNALGILQEKMTELKLLTKSHVVFHDSMYLGQVETGCLLRQETIQGNLFHMTLNQFIDIPLM